MPNSDKNKKQYTRDEVNYQNYPKDSQKCEKCSYHKHTADKCKKLTDEDNDVSPSGWCKMYEPGKHVIIDLWRKYQQILKNKKIRRTYQ